MIQNFYDMSVDAVTDFLKTNLSKGLSSAEAAERLKRDGYNEFRKVKHPSLLAKFVAQFKSFMIIVLLISAVISGVVGYMNGEGVTDAFIILAIVIINALIGVFQENKAEKSLDALERMSAPQCKVRRDGDVKVIEARELVVGDVVVVEAGDVVPADIRLTEVANLQVQEASLTGESVPVDKNVFAVASDATIGDRTDMIYSSCSVTYGRGEGVVVAVGEMTEVGKIAAMLQSVPELQTPMQKRLDQLGKILAVTALLICLVIFIVGALYGNNLFVMFMTAISLAVAAIPEGLPAVSTIVLAVGVQRLAKRNAIVRNLPSVETLGSTTIICSDKTGTLTQNKMTVTEVYAEGEWFVVDKYDQRMQQLLEVAVLANDASYSDAMFTKSVGDPTEVALLDVGRKHNVLQMNICKSMPRVAELPFDSERKLMTTVHALSGGEFFVAVKGGLDEILSCCSSVVVNAKKHQMTEADKEKIIAVNCEMAGRALRVLAMAYKKINALSDDMVNSAQLESELTFVGMVGMIDPPRIEVRDAIAQCRRAGIKPVMITGDHKITAATIARSLGILDKGDKVLTGAEVESMSNEELFAIAPQVSVFARVAPEHKSRIVRAYQLNNNVVAMTGDGVNDAPALKLANIGVAMGITGTDVSKEASDVVLADDNFATIVSSVKEGRRIYANLLKDIQFMLAANLGEVLTLFVAVICNWAAPLFPIHILWVNLVTDSLPALALSVDPADDDIMDNPPIDPNQGIMTKSFVVRLILQGCLVAFGSLMAYYIGLQQSLDVARTMTFATVVFSQMTLILSIRSGNHFFTKGLFANRWLWGAIAVVISLMLIVMLIPALQTLFHVVPLTSVQWWCIIGLSFVPMVVVEVVKFVQRLIKK